MFCKKKQLYCAAAFFIVCICQLYGLAEVYAEVLTSVLEGKAHLESKSSTSKIGGLKWLKLDLPVFVTNSGQAADTATVSTRIDGEFNHKDWTLLFGGKKVAVTDGAPLGGKGQNRFAFKVPIKSSVTTLEIIAVNAYGEIEKELVTITYPKWDEYVELIRLKALAARKVSYTTVGFGFTTLSFRQTNKPDLSLQALTIKGAYQRVIVAPNWDVAASVFLSALPVRNNLSSVSVRFVGVNFRVGYAMPFIKEPWRLMLLVGGYYSTMFVSPKQFGYTNIYGPQVFPSLRRTLGNGDILATYFKLSPVTDGASVMSLSTRELAVGMSWSRPMKGSEGVNSFWADKLVSVTLDVADLALSFGSSKGRSTSVTLGGALGW